MISKTSEQRLAENEIYFRTQNEKIQKAIDEINKMATEDGFNPIDIDPDSKLLFLCECSHMKCTERVQLSLNEYKHFHKRRDMFSIKPGHEIKDIEAVVHEADDFTIVVKDILPPTTKKTGKSGQRNES